METIKNHYTLVYHIYAKSVFTIMNKYINKTVKYVKQRQIR